MARGGGRIPHNPPSMKIPARVSPYLLLTLANLFWAGNWIVSRAFRAELPPVAIAGIWLNTRRRR